jgi:pimeloyl-ACP methyl ester carboxylesterase
MTSDTAQLLHPYPDLPLTLTKVGSGRPLLVLHGGHGPANSTPIVDHFAATHSVILPTHPGWNDTPRPEWFSSMDDLAITYLNILEDDDLRDVMVIAPSFGGWIASEMAIRDRGHRISRLVLIGAIGPDVPGFQVQGVETVEGVVPMEVVYAYAGRSLRDPKLLRRLGRVRTRTLVIWGENDPVLPPEFGQVYADAFANARFEVIPGAGHMPVHEAPQATFAAIDTFLAQS